MWRLFYVDHVRHYLHLDVDEGSAEVQTLILRVDKAADAKDVPAVQKQKCSGLVEGLNGENVYSVSVVVIVLFVSFNHTNHLLTQRNTVNQADCFLAALRFDLVQTQMLAC